MTPVTPRPNLYLCSRTSMYGDKPCEEAFRIPVLRVDRRSTDDPKKVPAHKGSDGSWWWNEGTNHRLENGMICRDMGVDLLWAVEVPDLSVFVKEHGDCVIGYRNDGFMHLEIYDDYRE